jgi:hypothetical protein
MTKGEYKKIVDEFINCRWNFLYDVAKNISKNKITEASDLVAELVIFLYDNKLKLEPYIDINMLEGFSVSWMRLQSQYDTTPFNIKYKGKGSKTDYIEDKGRDIPFEIEDESVIDYDHLDEDEYIKDLRYAYTDEQINKILKVHGIYPTLSKVNKLLFDAYFMEGLSYDKIKDKYTFFRTDKNGKKRYYKTRYSVYQLMIKLKQEINNKL